MTRQVLVTGGGSGIGRQIARDFARQGEEVTISGRRLAALKETDEHAQMRCLTGDISDEAQVAALFDRPYDVVVANAGIATATRIGKETLAGWQKVMDVTLTGVFLTFREALRQMQPGGRLIAIASTAALQGGASIPAYAAAKHGVLGLVRSVAQDVAKKGITCNAVCPGFVDTEMGQQAVTNVVDKLGVAQAEAEAMIVSGNPAGRMIHVAEVSSAVLYLASPGAAMVNGHALSVSGGEI
jgi:NAD(P)-dependent dehydrogenase (short-subunit alcohol dehydrogenase family)